MVNADYIGGDFSLRAGEVTLLQNLWARDTGKEKRILYGIIKSLKAGEETKSMGKGNGTFKGIGNAMMLQDFEKTDDDRKKIANVIAVYVDYAVLAADALFREQVDLAEPRDADRQRFEQVYCENRRHGLGLGARGGLGASRRLGHLGPDVNFKLTF